MSDIRFTKDHEYVRVEGDVATVGISDYAQQQLGDVVFVELPAIGAKLEKGAGAAVVESVKAASDVFAPVSGEVVAANADVDKEPALINQDALGGGWLMKIKLANPSELDGLMNQADYDAFLKTL
ncbi:MAG: glycine cleavage system protein GcvH [Hyphomicrobiales bacterium]|nr:glycine cleavage system protein GcvH [Hyphomicrobiales bacterium]